jgi:signal transduction histidine kinase
MAMSTSGEHLTTPPSTGSNRLWIAGAYASFSLAILMVLVIAGWAVYVDFAETQQSLLQADINRLRSHAVRTVLRIQDEIRTAESQGRLVKIADTATWLRDHWNRVMPLDPTRLYSAVMDNDRKIVMHSRPELVGNVLPAEWQDKPVAAAGVDVFETSLPELTGGVRALDIELPIVFENVEVGTYHSGFNLGWFEGRLAERRAVTRQRWGLAFAFMTLVIALAGVSLYHITRRLSSLQGELSLGQVRRLAELGQLAGSIAHEVRNPLNAIGLNLHVIQRLLDTHQLSNDRTNTIFRETMREMERVDGLLRTLLNYARPDVPHIEKLDLAGELQSISDFLRPVMERDGITYTLASLPKGVGVAFDRSRFRQIVLNLIKNATEAVGPGGRIDVALHRREDAAELVVRDYGPGVEPELGERIFEPFFTTKEVGTGLGLTLVKRYVQEAGGTVALQASQIQGAVFVVRLPLVRTPSNASPQPEVAVSHVA